VTNQGPDYAKAARAIEEAARRANAEEEASKNGVAEHSPPVNWALQYLAKARTNHAQRIGVEAQNMTRFIAAQGELIGALTRACYAGLSRPQSAVNVAHSFRAVVDSLVDYEHAGVPVAWHRVPKDLAASVAAVREARLDWKATFIEAAAARVRKAVEVGDAPEADRDRAFLWLLGGLWKSLGRIAGLRFVAGSFIRAKKLTPFEKFERAFLRLKRPDLVRLFTDNQAPELAPDLLEGWKDILAFLASIFRPFSEKTVRALIKMAGLPITLRGRGRGPQAAKSELRQWCDEQARAWVPDGNDVAALMADEAERARRGGRAAFDGGTIAEVAPGVVESD